MRQVTPLFKRDEQTDKQSYRPVTVLPRFNNIFESLLSVLMQDISQGLLSDFISALQTTSQLRNRAFQAYGAYAEIGRNW